MPDPPRVPVRVLCVDGRRAATGLWTLIDDEFSVVSETSVEEALEGVATDDFDCVVSEYDIGESNGIEFLEDVRQRDEALPFILCTGEGSEDIASEAISAGVTDYLQRESEAAGDGVLAERIESAVETYRDEQAVVERKEHLETCFEEAPLGVIEWDENFELTRMNTMAENFLGYDQADLAGQSPEAIVPESGREPAGNEVTNLLESRGDHYTIDETVRGDGSRIFFEWHHWAVTENDSVVGVYSMFRDITEQGERRGRFEAIFDNTYTFAGLLQTDGVLLEANDTALSFGGLDRDDVVGKPIWETYWFRSNSETQSVVREAVERASEGELFRDNIEVRGADRDAVIDFSVRPITDENGHVELLVPEGRDVTERNRFQRRLNRLIDNVPGIFYRCKNERGWPMEIVKGGAEELTGYQRQEITNERDFFSEEIIHPDDREDVWEAVQRTIDAEDPFELTYRICTKGGGVKWVKENGEGIYAADGSVEALEGMITDITEQKERERALQQNEQRYRNLVDNSPVPINLFDEDGTTVWGNDAVLELLGLDERDELIGRSIFEFIHPADSDVAEVELEDVIHGDDVVGPTDFRLVRTDGEIRFVRIKTTGGWYEGNRVGQAVVVDVTELKEKTAELRRTERRYRTLVEMSPNPIVVHSDGDIVFTNDAFARMVGIGRVPDVLGSSILEYLPAPERDDTIEAARKTQRGEQLPTNTEHEIRTADGERRHVSATSRPIVYQDDSAVLTVLNDRTEAHRYRTAVESLHEKTREMFRNDDVASIATVAVEAAETLIGLTGGTVYEFDESRNTLVAVAQSEAVTEKLGDPTPVGPGDGTVVWETFVDGTRQHVTDPTSAESIVADGVVEGVLAVPIGNHGVFTIVTTDGDGLSDTELELCSILAANLEAALDSVEREAALNEREEQLERQNEELGALQRLNGIIRDINRSLFDATTREAARAAVCDRLGNREIYTAVWIGERDDDFDHFVPVSTDGSMEGLADHVADDSVAAPLQSLLARTAESEAVHTVDRVLNDHEWDSMRKSALQFGFQSVAAVPIPLQNDPDEVLVMHARESDAFTEDQRVVFAELGRLIGSAVDAMGATNPQLTQSWTELDLRIADDRLVCNRIATGLGATMTLHGAIPSDDGTHVAFFQADAAPEAVTALAEEIHTLDSVAVVVDDESSGFYQCTGMSSPFFDLLYEHDARLQTMEAEEGATSITVRVPNSTSVRDFHDDIHETFAASELTARRSNVGPVESPMTVRETIREACTTRQYQALQAAFYGGYYEWPRSATNEDLARALDIASPTYQSHRRAAEQVVMATLFDGAESVTYD